jgi:hypothetical protein
MFTGSTFGRSCHSLAPRERKVFELGRARRARIALPLEAAHEHVVRRALVALAPRHAAQVRDLGREAHRRHDRQHVKHALAEQRGARIGPVHQAPALVALGQCGREHRVARQQRAREGALGPGLGARRGARGEAGG